MSPVNPRANECWLLEPRPGDPDSGLAVLVLESGGGDVLAAPLFMEDEAAMPEDRKLLPEPDFLLGESWVALTAARRIPGSGFRQRLGEIPAWQGHELCQVDSRLPRGLPLLAWLGDGRLEARKMLEECLRSRASALALVASLGRLMYDSAAEQWSLTADRVAEAVQILSARARSVPAMVRGETKPEPELSFTVPGGTAVLRLEPLGGRWLAKLHFDFAATSVECLDGEEEKHAGASFDDWWFIGEDAGLASGECLFSWRGENTGETQISVFLPSSALEDS